MITFQIFVPEDMYEAGDAIAAKISQELGSGEYAEYEGEFEFFIVEDEDTLTIKHASYNVDRGPKEASVFTDLDSTLDAQYDLPYDYEVRLRDVIGEVEEEYEQNLTDMIKFVSERFIHHRDNFVVKDKTVEQQAEEWFNANIGNIKQQFLDSLKS